MHTRVQRQIDLLTGAPDKYSNGGSVSLLLRPLPAVYIGSISKPVRHVVLYALRLQQRWAAEYVSFNSLSNFTIDADYHAAMTILSLAAATGKHFTADSISHLTADIVTPLLSHNNMKYWSMIESYGYDITFSHMLMDAYYHYYF